MRKIFLYPFLFIVTVILIPAALPAGISNEWIVPNHKDGCGSNTFFINNKTGWFSGYTEIICRTDDGGLTLQKQDVGMQVSSFFFLDDAIGWAVGSIEEREEHLTTRVWGQIRGTVDGGKTWKTEYNEFMGTGLSNTGLHSIFFVTPSLGWAVGGKGFTVHTIDGGKHWEHQESGSSLILLEVHFSDEKNGVIVGDNRYALGEDHGADQKAEGVVLYTDDGGENWRKVWSRRPVLINGLNFINSKTGFATVEMIDGSLLLITSNGGKSWSETKVNYREVGRPLFKDRNRGLITMDKDLVIVTYDGGKTWRKMRKPLREHPWHFSEVFEKGKP